MKSSKRKKFLFSIFSGMASIAGLIIAIIEANRITNWILTLWINAYDQLNQHYYIYIQIIATVSIIALLYIFFLQQRRHYTQEITIKSNEQESRYKNMQHSLKKENKNSIECIATIFSNEHFFQMKSIKKLFNGIAIIENKYADKLRRIDIKEKPESVEEKCNALKIEFLGEIYRCLQACSREKVNSLRRYIDKFLLERYNRPLKVRVALNLIGDKNLDYLFYLDSRNQPDIKKGTDIGDLYIKDTILDDNCNYDVTLKGSISECYGYKLISNTALLESATSKNFLFCSNDTHSIPSYTPGPNVLEFGFNAKLCVPIYSKVVTDSERKLVNFDAFLCILIDNSAEYKIFLENELERDSIVRLTRSCAIAFSIFFEKINNTLHTITNEKIENGAVINSKGYHKQINRRTRRLL